MTKSFTALESKPEAESLSIFEVSSLATGYRMVNDLGADSRVQLVEASVLSPGKFFILLRGNEPDLRQVSEDLRNRYQRDWIDDATAGGCATFVLPSFYNLNKTQLGDFVLAFEGETLSASIQAAALASKVPGVEVLDFRVGRGIGGKSLLLLTGKKVPESQIQSLRGKLEAVRSIFHVELIENLSEGFRSLMDPKGEFL